MTSKPPTPPSVDHYRDEAVARSYARRGKDTLRARISDRREKHLCSIALARVGRVERVLDCPAGTGRFWRLLCEHCDELHVCDAAQEMLDVARAEHPDIDVASCTVALAQELPHSDESMDLVFCSRLLHHLTTSEERIEVLNELARVARRHVVISTMITPPGNALRMLARRFRKPGRPRQRVSVPVRQLEDELRVTGLVLLQRLYKLRGLSPIVVLVCEKRSD